jgi:hypothetical protein
MYRPHNPTWFALGFLVCLVLFAVGVIKQRRGQVAVPSGVLVALGLLAGTQLIVMLALRAYNDSRMRQELKSIAPAEIQKLTLTRDAASRVITSPADISSLLGLLQSASGVAAHHSSPMNPFEIEFEFHDTQYRYRVAADSERAGEFWVFPLGPSYAGGEGIELGRVRSDKLGPLVDRLLSVPN